MERILTSFCIFEIGVFRKPMKFEKLEKQPGRLSSNADSSQPRFSRVCRPPPRPTRANPASADPAGLRPGRPRSPSESLERALARVRHQSSESSARAHHVDRPRLPECAISRVRRPPERTTSTDPDRAPARAKPRRGRPCSPRCQCAATCSPSTTTCLTWSGDYLPFIAHHSATLSLSHTLASLIVSRACARRRRHLLRLQPPSPPAPTGSPRQFDAPYSPLSSTAHHDNWCSSSPGTIQTSFRPRRQATPVPASFLAAGEIPSSPNLANRVPFSLSQLPAGFCSISHGCSRLIRRLVAVPSPSNAAAAPRRLPSRRRTPSGETSPTTPGQTCSSHHGTQCDALAEIPRAPRSRSRRAGAIALIFRTH